MSEIQSYILEDETDFLQLGQSDEYNFIALKDKFTMQDSAWNKFPTPENPRAKYKFCSFNLSLVEDLQKISRQTYSFLDWLGDCGGLVDMLVLIGRLLISPFAAYAL